MDRMQGALARLATFGAALLGSLAGVLVVLPLGLVAAELVVFPLTIGVAALLAALAVGWAGSLLAPDGSRTRLLPTVRAAGAMATVVAALLLAYLALAERVLPRVLAVPPIVLGAVSALLLAAGATAATWRYRTAERRLARDVRLTLALLALAGASVPAVLVAASLVGLTGA